jgi:mono/diheme cytochrome c family protein
MFSGPNLPYSLATTIALGALIAFIVFASPFSADPSASAGSTPTVISGDAAAGQTTFNNRCSVCHGPGGEGIVGLGKPLTTSEFAAGLSDAELLAFLQVGRPSDDPLNTTGIAMPARGGTPALDDGELADVIAYLRTIGPG